VTAGWRLLDERHSARDAAAQMARDVALLDEVTAGAAPALRFYQWRPPALSLGRFQPLDDVDIGACERHGVGVVRRPTGGRALLHGGDLTYAIVFPVPPGPRPSVDALYRWVAAGLIAGLARLGVDAHIARHDGPAGPACFATQQGADLRVGDRKLCGSAQLRRRGVVLQHGSVLLDRLAIDETDLLHAEHDSRGLQAATVTLAELGVDDDASAVVEALRDGFRAALGLEFSSIADSSISS